MFTVDVDCTSDSFEVVSLPSVAPLPQHRATRRLLPLAPRLFPASGQKSATCSQIGPEMKPAFAGAVGAPLFRGAAQSGFCSRTGRPWRSVVSTRRHAPVLKASANPGPTPLAPAIDTTWELDFYSRPVLGADGKKLWELIIVDASGRFEHVEVIPNSLVNSRELRKRISDVIDDAPVKPLVIRFFRKQMMNMITIALSQIDVQVRPSRRTYSLFQLLKERERQVYPNMPGYSEGLAQPAFSFVGVDLELSEALPDALRCEKFGFGRLPLGQLEAFFEGASPTDYFGDSCIVDGDISKDVMVPGIVVFSRRAKALAGWMSGVELAYVKALLSKQELALECGLTTRYRFAAIDDTIKPEARDFQNGKEAVGGLHFLAIQASEASEEVEGMWLLTESDI